MNAFRLFGAVAGAILLVACGGGSSDQSVGPGPIGSLTISSERDSVEANPRGLAPDPDSPHTVQISVRFVNATGGLIADGTSVNLSTSSVARGVVSPVDAPDNTGSSASSPTSSGFARFWFNAGSQPGPVSLNASATDPNSGRLISASLQLTVAPFTGTDPERLVVTAISTSLPANILDIQPSPNSQFSTQINVAAVGPTGAAVANGTEISIGVDDVSRATIAPINDPGSSGATATATTTAGTARFLLTSARQTGTVNLIASMQEDDGTVVSEPLQITIQPNTEDDSRLRITGSNTMPTNTQGVPIFLGSPFINELTVEYIGPDGQVGDVSGGEVAVAVAPVNRGAFSTLDDPSTPDVNEFEVLVGAGPVVMTAGVTTLFIHSFDQPGPLTVTVVAVDASTGERFSSKFVVEMIDGAADFLPAQLDFSVSPNPVYIQGSGGSTTKSLQLIVRDSAGNMVPNPEADGNRWNNVHLELIAPEGSGARLTGTGANGSVNGQQISVQTVNGIANFALNAGSAIGSHRIIATVDRADNNVDNDIIDPLRSEVTIEVGDGQLFALTLVSPILNAIRVNRAIPGIDASADSTVDPDSGIVIPSDPDGTYSFTVTAQGTDKIGNPVLPGTVVNFGKIDDPLTPGQPRFFVFSGPDGNPEEGGTLFSVFESPEGFLDNPLIVDESVEPGDTVALFGKSVPGNREHEAVRFVQSVVDDNTVVVTQPFNPNNATGSIVDDGFVIPWVIGRSQVGVIDQSVTLNDQGRGSVQLTYPISELGRPLVLWTQGTRVESEGNKTVADVEAILYPGVAPLQLRATPSAIQGNTTTTVRLCLTDALGSPVQGAFINGGIISGPANGQLDGVPMVTTTANATGTDGAGCVNTAVTISGMSPEGEESELQFRFGQAEATVQIVPPGSSRLLVNPSLFTDFSQQLISLTVELRLLGPSNEPISGVILSGECSTDSSGVFELQVQPGATNDQGIANAVVLLGLSECASPEDADEFPRIGRCEFTTPSGTPVGLFTAIGVNLRGLQVSPPCPPLPQPQPDTGILSMSVEDNRVPAGSSLVESTPSGISCTASGGSGCQSSFNNGTEVILRAPSGTTPQWIGACTANPNDARFASVSISTGSTSTCQVVFN